ncbi:MAG: hypothetical protein M3083_12270 [Actinomycetota bacterium]|nr:hypothetical protein [Actinomycetota bacterium]
MSIGKPRALEADTIRTYAGTLRRAVGADHFPDAGRRGYTLSGAARDWGRFRDLVVTVAHGGEPARQAQALALVRGSPFSELPNSGFGWVATELLVSQVEVAVTAAAQRLLELALAAGDWPLAAWAADQGLNVSPTAQDLNSGALRAAELSGRADRRAQAWRDITRRYTAAEEPVPDELQQLHDQTRRKSPSTPQH